jgi:predicted transcriptional regulator
MKVKSLTRREREIMDALFALGNQASAVGIRAHLTGRPGNSSVRVMLARLERKGWVRHRRDGRRHIYSATISLAVARRKALQGYLQTFFCGSLPQMVTTLVTQLPWTDEELEGFISEIDRVRLERKKK